MIRRVALRVFIVALAVVASGAAFAANPRNSTLILPSLSAYDCGARAGTASDQSTAIDACVALLSPTGGNLTIPLGVNFKLTSLTFPSPRVSITYYQNSDLSNRSIFGRHVTNELVTFNANSSCTVSGPTCNGNGNVGVVNEYVLSSPFGTGSLMAVRCDIGGFLKWQGLSQYQDAPCRAQWVIEDTNLTVFRIVHEMFMDEFSTFSGNSLQGFAFVEQLNGIGTSDWPALPAANTVLTNTTGTWRGFLESTANGAPGNTVIRLAYGVPTVGDHIVSTTAINGIGRADWSTIPAIGATVTGQSSGATGTFFDVGQTDTILIPVSGSFTNGEHITSGAVTPTPVITTVINGSKPSPAVATITNITTRNFQAFGQDVLRGAWSIGQPMSAVLDEFAVGGGIACTPTQTVGQYTWRTVSNCEYSWINTYGGGSPPVGYSAAYSASAARILMYPYNSDPDNNPQQALADLSAGDRIHFAINDSGFVGTSAFNNGAFTAVGGGVYTVAVPVGVFTNATAQCTLGKASNLDNPSIVVTSSTLLTITNTNMDGTTAHILRAQVNVNCSGGDK